MSINFCNLLEAMTLEVMETEVNRQHAQEVEVRRLTYCGLNKALSGSCEISEHQSTDKQLLCLWGH